MIITIIASMVNGALIAFIAMYLFKYYQEKKDTITIKNRRI